MHEPASVAHPFRSARILANGAQLYCEIRGDAAPVLFIPGATGDAGHFRHVADALCDEFRVITYDRRGNSRSRPPEGWSRTSIAEHADDVAALLQELGATPAVVFGTSGGGTILVDLLCRHAGLLKGAILHEPVLNAVVPSGPQVKAALLAMREEVATQGARATQERFLRWAGTDEVFESMDSDLRERLLGNGKLFLDVELPLFLSYAIDVDALRRSQVPLIAAGGIEDRGTPMVEGNEWLARELCCETLLVPGFHAPYWHPGQSKDLAEALRPALAKLAL